MSLATLNGHRATECRVQLPAHGVWYADATLDGDVDLAGKVTLQLADLTLSGTIVSGGAYKGGSTYRIAAGAGGWGRTAPARGYASDAGVRLATVLADAALVATETLDLATVPATTVGPAWTREAGPASRALQLLAAENWHVGQDGVTRFGRRAVTTVTTDAPRIAYDAARRVLTLAADSLAALVPGAVVDGVEASDVLHELGPQGLRSTLLGTGTAPGGRRLVALRQLIAQLLPDYRFRGVSEYRVVTQTGARLNLQPILSSLGLPDLLNVRVRPGVAGCTATVALGSSALVAFVNGDPARPVVVGFEDADGAGFVPSTTAIKSSTSSTIDAPSVLLGGPLATDPVMLSLQLQIWVTQVNLYLTTLAPLFNAGMPPVAVMSLGPGGVVPPVAIPTAATRTRSL